MARASARTERVPFLEAPDLAAGFLAAAPLLLAYEVGHALAAGAAPRAPAERVLTLVLSPAGEHAGAVRAVLLLVAIGACISWRGRSSAEPALSIRRQMGEGVLAGVALAPVLFALLALNHDLSFRVQAEAPRALPAALRLAGAAPWEELLFRVGVYGILFLLVARSARFLGLGDAPRVLVAELSALLGSALLFAVFHLDLVQRLLGSPGEPYRPGVFLWRVSAGILLATLMRWRGLGVAAWAHAVFNLGIALAR